MGTISKYAQLMTTTRAVQPVVLKEPQEVLKGNNILPDAVVVTVAEFDVSTKNAITAHHIKDYRRKRFNLRLLPKVETLFDKLLAGSDYWNELLQNESANT